MLEHQAGTLSRRQFIGASGSTLAGTLGLLGTLPAWARADEQSGAGKAALIVRQKEPLNLESPFHSLHSFLTPNPLFYVRNHFSMPQLNVSAWRLQIEGAVSNRLTLSLDELRKLPSRTVTATLECAGNGRSYLEPKTSGVQWKLGAVGNAEWTGVPLSAVLERAGLRDGAVEVVLEGADRGVIAGEGKPAGPIQFARSLPLKKARQAEVLLAYKMNGADLPVTHGFPLRAIVPGWYGVASIKWLQRLVVTDRPFTGYFQSMDYSYYVTRYGTARVIPITELQVKAAIARPAAGESIASGTAYVVRGAAWAAGSGIAKVEVSTDGGRSWSAAQLMDKKEPFAWRLWEYRWQTPDRPGQARLMARATDGRGQVQPLKRDPNLRNYLINYVLPVDVTIQ